MSNKPGPIREAIESGIKEVLASQDYDRFMSVCHNHLISLDNAEAHELKRIMVVAVATASLFYSGTESKTIRSAVLCMISNSSWKGWESQIRSISNSEEVRSGQNNISGCLITVACAILSGLIVREGIIFILRQIIGIQEMSGLIGVGVLLVALIVGLGVLVVIFKRISSLNYKSAISKNPSVAASSDSVNAVYEAVKLCERQKDSGLFTARDIAYPVHLAARAIAAGDAKMLCGFVYALSYANWRRRTETKPSAVPFENINPEVRRLIQDFQYWSAGSVRIRKEIEEIEQEYPTLAPLSNALGVIAFGNSARAKQVDDNAEAKQVQEIVAKLRTLRQEFDKAKKEEEEFRTGAALKLGETRDFGAVAPLIDALEDTRASVRANAAMALGHLGYKEAVSPLIDLLQKEKDTNVCKNVVMALGSIGAKEALIPLFEFAHFVNLKSADDVERVREVIEPTIEAYRALLRKCGGEEHQLPPTRSLV